MRLGWWLVAIVIVGSVLRLVWLDKLPPGFNADEAAFGYNAYSLLETGKDEWGTLWWKLPFTSLRSFGDYKLPLYAFLTVPSIKIWGLNEFATRLPNAILSSLAIIAVYKLAQVLFDKRTAIYSASLLAISPWHISLSRGAFEANLITLLLPLGLYLYLVKKPTWSGVTLALSMYSYHSARLVVPLVVVLLVSRSWQKSNKLVLALVATYLLFSLPALISYLGAGSARVADVGIFSPTDNWQSVASRRFAIRNRQLPDQMARLFSNKLVYTTSTFAGNYLAHFSPQFLFTQGVGDAAYGLLPGWGVMHYGQLVFIASFVALVVKRPTASLWLVVALLLVAALPSALAKGPVAGNRAAPMLSFLTLASAVGAVYVVDYFRQKAAWINLALVASLAGGLAFFLSDYIYYSPSVTPQQMNYGWRELVPRLIPIAENFAEVKFSRTLSEPHIFVAFYRPVPPAQYQRATADWLKFEALGYKFLDQLDGYHLGKYRFGDIHPTDPVTQPTLYVGRSSDFPPDFPSYFEIYYPNGTVAIKVAQKLPEP